ncbi:MAG TPA: DNA polymerase III subunit alpha [Vicinamibacterales bacterium]|nr:DNA polymerase III subunit alpha [Vicinamibacterales bacterium]
MYTELHASSAFSFLDGASLPEVLVDRAVALGYPALALLDRDGVYGAPRFHLAAKRAGIKPIIGAELTVSTASREQNPAPRRAESRGRGTPSREERLFTLPVLIESQRGYRHLCRLVTTMKRRAAKGEGALTFDDLDGHTEGLVALAGRTAIDGARYGIGGLVDRIVGTFGASQVYIELQRHLLREQEWDNQVLRELATAFHLPVIATNGVRFAEPSDRALYDVLTCIRHKTTLERAGRRLTCNAERYLKSPEAMARLFADDPRALAGTGELAARLAYSMTDLGYRFPEYRVPPGETMGSFLRKMTQAGARERYRPYDDRARRQIERELDLIDKLELAGYFLIVWDIVNYCRQHDILVQGRGSAANSAVCYSLGITAVDPIGMELLFERFLSEERGEWPDIDLDLPSGDRREQVIQHMYEKYGTHGGDTGPRIAMTANVITYRGRSAAREVGKALSLQPEQIDRLAKVMNHFEWVDPSETLERNLREVGIDVHNPAVQLFGQLWQRIQDLPRHLGQHSGGMVICQGRLDDVVPLENASMPDRVVVQWDKDDCADMGLIKVDLLGLGMMAVIQDALTLVNGLGARDSGLGARTDSDGARDSGLGGKASTHQGHPGKSKRLVASEEHRLTEPRAPSPEPRHEVVDLAHLPPNDPTVYKMLQEADTVGIFQVESRAQMATLPRLRPACFYDIVVEVAIIRPGPIVGQMVHPYLKRRQGAEAVSFPHPSLQPILQRTLGVPLFQEQLLRMAMVAAGFSGGEAEELRRAFGFKRSEKRMAQIETKLRAGMERQGITGDAAEEIIRSITSFALYGFPESHAASFALLVYASAYLKAHYPAAFFTAMLNNQPMGFYHPATLVKDAQRHGVRFAPIDVQISDWECRVEPDGRVRLGLMYVNGLRQETGRSIETVGARGSGLGAREFGGASSSCAVEFGRPVALRCPKCGNDDQSMLEDMQDAGRFCNICAHEWSEQRSNMALNPEPRAPSPEPRLNPRFSSIEDLISRTALRRDELATLAEIGALNAFGHDRRSALWQIERAARPAGDLFRGQDVEDSVPLHGGAGTSPLSPMTPSERLMSDYSGTSLTIGPHPLAFRRMELAMRGVLRAIDLPRGKHGRRVRVAGAVITRQRPGTAKGFVFLTLEDETGIANIIVRPDLFGDQRQTIVGAPYLMVEGILQIQEGVTSVKAERLVSLGGEGPEPQSHDFR